MLQMYIGVSGQAVNGGYTGYNTAKKNKTEGFWLAGNGWNAQGCLENDDNKLSMNLNHMGNAKSGASATTLGGGRNVKQTIIITPLSFQGETCDYRFETNEIYLGSANSDGNIGNYEIYVSDTAKDISTEPDDDSWQLLTSGNITSDWKLEKVYNGAKIKFRYMKIIAYSRTKSYMELAAVKVFSN